MLLKKWLCMKPADITPFCYETISKGLNQSKLFL